MNDSDDDGGGGDEGKDEKASSTSSQTVTDWLSLCGCIWVQFCFVDGFSTPTTAQRWECDKNISTLPKKQSKMETVDNLDEKVYSKGITTYFTNSTLLVRGWPGNMF